MGRLLFQLASFLMFGIVQIIYIGPMLFGDADPTTSEKLIYFSSMMILFGMWVVEDKIDEIKRLL